MVNKVLQDAQDIVLIGSSSDPEKYVFAVAPSREFRKRCFDSTMSHPDEKGVNAFNRYWQFNEQTGEINGSSFYLGLKLDKEIRKGGLWIPGVQEARVLDAKRKLTNGVYRDLGAVTYSDASPNITMAHSLASSGRELPIVFAFRGLDYKINSKADLGVEILVAEKPSGIICGKEAEKMLAQFNYRADSGALRLFRDNDGSWDAYWNYFDFSYADGRVGDWVCGEAARAELKGAYDALDERKFGIRIEELKKSRQKKKEAFKRELGV